MAKKPPSSNGSYCFAIPNSMTGLALSSNTGVHIVHISTSCKSKKNI